MGEQVFSTEFEYACRSVSARAGVRCKLTMTGIPDFTFESTDLWGQDPATGRIHWYTVTNAC
jgi:hypothetical protein